jgi:CRP-like cAMP-binding protein
VHSHWLAQLKVFESISDETSKKFFLELALKLHVELFAPSEHVIQEHQEADSIMILQRGILLESHSMRFVTQGGVAGLDALGRFRCASACL